jgi:hypothetical protein
VWLSAPAKLTGGYLPGLLSWPEPAVWAWQRAVPPGASGRPEVRGAQRAAAQRTRLAEPGGKLPGDRERTYRRAPERRVPGYGRSSRTMLTAVWVTCRNRLKPASPASCRTAAGPAWAPSATPPGWARAAGVHWKVDAA